MNCTVSSVETALPALPLIRFIYQEECPVAGLSAQEFSGDAGALLMLRNGATRELLVGLGAKAKATADIFSRASGAAIRSLQKQGFTRAAADLKNHAARVKAITEGAIIGAYHFDTFVPRERKLKSRFEALQLRVAKADLSAAKKELERGIIHAEAVNFTRSIGDLPGNYVQPETLAEVAIGLAAEYPELEVNVLDEERLAKGGFGGIMAVGAGSVNPPRLIVLEYNGAPAGKKVKGKSAAPEKPIVLVGKAITFDSGGISIKVADKMDEMKFDKMGGCAVLGVMQAVARLKPKKNIVAIIASAENLLDGKSYRPGDIVTTYDGKTIEILNTDAEGRVVLADALSFARIQYQPEEIIDMATLTGAVVVALGTYRAGAFASSDEIAAQILAAGEASGDRVWPLPHDAPYHEQIKSDVALAKNTGGRYGGASTAAAFLEKWVENTPWLHLDIAGVAWTDKDAPHLSKGATGFGVRLLLEYLEKRS